MMRGVRNGDATLDGFLSGEAARSRGWLSGPLFDLALLILPGLACLLLVLPFVWYGPVVVMPIYTAYLVLFGLPHNYLTWATILPRQSRQALNWELVRTMFLSSLALCALIPLSQGTEFCDWVLSAIALLSIWHVYRQHHGIAKIYDAVQSKRSGDSSIFVDRGLLSLFFGLASLGVLVWVFTHRDVSFLMSSDERYVFVHPVVPWRIYQLYMSITGAIGLVGLKRAVFDRIRAGKSVPVPQLALMTSALASFWGPYLFIPLSAMPLAMAIATIFHNIQYFGFVWLYERGRCEELAREGGTLALPQRLAAEGRWRPYLAWALAFSFAVIAAYAAFPHRLGMFLIYFIGVSHYLVDGSIWRNRDNRHLGRALGRISSG
jgi:hypothetical protein